MVATAAMCCWRNKKGHSSIDENDEDDEDDDGDNDIIEFASMSSSERPKSYSEISLVIIRCASRL